MKTQTSIRIDPGQKTLFQKAAAQAHEDLTEFLINSAMLRIQLRQLALKPHDPMKVLEGIYLETYDPSQVSRKDAYEIGERNAAAAKGELTGPVIGTAKVRPPKSGGHPSARHLLRGACLNSKRDKSPTGKVDL